MPLNYFDGSIFQSGTPRWYDGSSFQQKPVKVYTGSSWQSVGRVVVEDHEGGQAATDLYAGNTANSSIDADSTLEGSYLLNVSDEHDPMAYDETGVTTRGNAYRSQVYSKGTGRVWFLVGVQDPTSPVDDCYVVRLNTGDELALVKRSLNSGNDLMASTSVPISSATPYTIGLDYGPTGQSDNLIARVFDESGNELDSCSAQDDEHEGGTFGFYSGSGTGMLADYITEEGL